MARIVAYCGLVCSECRAYLATQSGDREALEKVAAAWREEYQAPGITAEYATCDGCLLTLEGRTCGHCSECKTRACALSRGVENCAHCADYPCDRLTSFFAMVPSTKTVLDEIHASISGV